MLLKNKLLLGKANKGLFTMTKHLIAILLCFLFGFNKAQAPKYLRVNIKGEAKVLLPKLAALGWQPDHDHIGAHGIVAEISEQDANLFKQHNIAFDVLIDDLTAYYISRNQQSLKAAASVTDCNMPNIKTPTHFHLGSMGGFFTLAEMTAILDSMAMLYPNIITAKQPISTIQSIEGRNLWYVKISDNPNTDEAEPEVLYTAVHHAREPQSMSQLIFYMWYLLENYTNNAEIKSIVDHTEQFFIPCVNPDGYVYNQTNSPNGGGMWRKNRRVNAGGSFGVDLNRNYGYNWGFDNVGSSPNGVSDTYRGASAFSEPETQAVRNFCNARQFKAAINAHSFGNHLIYPWGYIPSLLTNDSVRFNHWGEYLTDKSAFSYGTCDQTLFYITNGSSDDWMYGEQNTKGKIYAFTPEVGSAYDGFWPASTRILDLCKFSFQQNLNTAKVVGSCAAMEDKTDHFLPPQGYVKFGLTNLGLSANTTTVSVLGVNNSLSSVGGPKVFANTAALLQFQDSIAFTVNPAIMPGQKIKIILRSVTDSYEQNDTLVKMAGMPVTVFYDNGSNLSGHFTDIGNWVNTGSTFVSAPSCISDGNGLYNSNDDVSITMNQVADLSNAAYAHLQYYTRFDIEKFFDMAQVQISTDNGSTFAPLCTPHQTAPRSYDGNEPIYDYRRDQWVKEEVDLSAYLGMGIVLRFSLKSDNGNEKDGIYLDDILIRKLAVNNNTAGLQQQNFPLNNKIIYPNPGQGLFVVKDGVDNTDIAIYNTAGMLVFTAKQVKQNQQLDLSALPDGLYFVSTANGLSQKLIVQH